MKRRDILNVVGAGLILIGVAFHYIFIAEHKNSTYEFIPISTSNPDSQNLPASATKHEPFCPRTGDWLDQFACQAGRDSDLPPLTRQQKKDLQDLGEFVGSGGLLGN